MRCSYAAYFFFPARIFAHLALCAAAIFLRADADMLRLGFGARPFAFAHRAFCARLIRLRANADTPRFGVVELRPPSNLPRTERAASTCLSRPIRFVLSDLNSDTKDANPFRFDIVTPSREIVI